MAVITLPKKEFSGLYVAYVFSCLGDRIWGFCIIFLLAHLGGLRLVTMNQLFQGLAQMALASFVGKWYDRAGRWWGVQLCLWLNNLSVSISAGLLVISLTIARKEAGSNTESAAYLASVVASILFCAISLAAASGEKTAFSKDWIVVMSASLYGPPNTAGSGEAGVWLTKVLSRQNALLTVIDQSASILSPIIGGLILDHAGYKTTCYIMIVWNAVGWILEAATLHWVYTQVPQLSVKKSEKDDKQGEEADENPTTATTTTVVEGFRAFGRHRVFPAAFGLAFLYATILAFDGISISFGEEQGLDSTFLGVFQAVGSAFGMLAAVSFPAITRRLGLTKTALLGVSAELAALLICVLSVFLPGSPFDPSAYFGSLTLDGWWRTFLQTFSADTGHSTKHGNRTGLDWREFTVDGTSAASPFSLFSGIALARYGLWLADLAITQLMQESVRESMRGTVFGIETAFCQFFSVFKDVSAILLPDEKTFGLLIFGSVVSVASAFCLVLVFNIKSSKLKER